MRGDIKRVLVLRCGALGDLVYATSVIDALRMQYGETVVIDFITTPGTAKLFEYDPRVHRVFALKHKKLPIVLSTQKREIIRTSRQNPYDLFISLEFGPQFKSLADTIHAKRKIGMGFSEITASPFEMNRGEFTKFYYRDSIDEAVLSRAKPSLSGVPQPLWSQKFSLPANAVVIAPSNSHNQKKGLNYRAWPAEHWRSLMAALAPRTPLIIVGARGEESFFDALKPYPDTLIDMVGKLSIPELITTVQNAKALICTDSATGHIGAAVDTPTFVLMGPNDPLTDSPYQSDTNAVYPISLRLSCSPCYKTDAMQQCRENVCMSRISPEMVLQSLESANVV